MILPGAGSEGLANRLAALTKQPVGRVETKSFPDGERYVRITDQPKGAITVVQSAWPPERTLDLLLLLDAAKRTGAGPVTAVIPYLAYARQDRIFQAGEALSAQVVAQAIGAAADRIITVDPHKTEILSFFGRPAHAVTAVAPIAAALKERKVEVVLAPDEGALERAQEVAKAFGAQSDHLEKTRIDSQTVEMRPKSLDVKGRRVAIVDDIISTGGTMATALALLKAQGAAATYAVGVHGLFIGNAEERLKKSGVDEILSTDTVPGPHSRISVANVLAEALLTSTQKAQ
jgi:ribose-phosphate pyrophosphokinase